ncbi:hypothetical protein BKA56DRAFT_490115 [Ilyonectria sp. MPI-CAGE-AT-0026]|nr:hypothetical protein BKA56DRAFT_490115 [Ilyonectria sp. MPI-CAGE-AT-0026]
MVKVVIAGATSVVAREVIDKIIAKNKHEVVGLSRNSGDDGIKWVQVDYQSQDSLVNVLEGADTVLCFFSGTTMADTQKNIIDAAIKAGVRRFAPSEWGTSKSNGGVAFYAFKDEVRAHLEKVNAEKKVLEYTLFQTGLFTDYFGHPYGTTRHLKPIQMYVDFNNRRAIAVGDGDSPVTLTTVNDIASVVTEAIDYPGEWPVTGGISGTQTTVGGLIRLGEKLRGDFTVDKLALEDLEAGELKSSWYPLIDHHGVPEDLRDQMSKGATIEFVRAGAMGTWSVSDEWNRLLPDYRFTSAEEYLTNVWEGKP